MLRLLRSSLLGMVACCAWQPAMAQTPSAASAQAEGQIRVVPAENVRIEYAQVLKVEPVYQTLRATRTEERCESTPVIQVPVPDEHREQPGVFSRMVDSVKGLFAREEEAPQPAPVAAAPARRNANCQLVQVDRQFQRPIAYDVDYVYKGTKYRSRLAEDPGNRLRIRVAVTPMVAEAAPVSP